MTLLAIVCARSVGDHRVTINGASGYTLTKGAPPRGEGGSSEKWGHLKKFTRDYIAVGIFSTRQMGGTIRIQAGGVWLGYVRVYMRPLIVGVFRVIFNMGDKDL